MPINTWKNDVTLVKSLMRNFDSGFRRNLTDNRKNNYALIFNIISKKVRTWYVQDTYQVLLFYIYFILYLFFYTLHFLFIFCIFLSIYDNCLYNFGENVLELVE